MPWFNLSLLLSARGKAMLAQEWFRHPSLLVTAFGLLFFIALAIRGLSQEQHFVVLGAAQTQENNLVVWLLNCASWVFLKSFPM